MGFFKEFKEFAVKGSAMDMAVGIIIGAAFNKIVTSLVNDIIMPPVGMMLGGVDFKNLAIEMKAAAVSATGVAIPAVSVKYGMFINTIIDFVIVALTIFVVIKAMNRVMIVKKPPQA